MAAKLKRNFFSNIAKRFHENKMTFLNAGVTIILIITVIFVLLNRASAMQRTTAEESVVNLTGLTAHEVQSYLLAQFDAVHNLSQIMKTYNNIEPDKRRAFFDDTMEAGLGANRGLVNIFTLWRPNALDGLDAEYINAEYHDETGQFVSGFTRERGWVEHKIFADYWDVSNWRFRDYFGYGVDIVTEPRAVLYINPARTRSEFGTTTASQRYIWVIDIVIPVLGEVSTQGEAYVLGIIGATISLEQLQTMCERTRPYETGHIFITSNSGTIAAHQDIRRRGTLLFGPRAQGTPFPDEILADVQDTIASSMSSMQPGVLRTRNELIVSYPFRTTSTITSATTYYAISNPPWTVVSVVPMSTVLATITALLRFSILFIIGAGSLVAFVLLATSRSLTQQARRLQQNLEQATVMQDNLKYGLFLMDDKFIIQGAYSKALEKILSVSQLQGKSFLELMSKSLRGHEMDGFNDYLSMIFKRSFDEQMLNSINPINEFYYTSYETGERKYLRSTFKLLEEGRVNLILGTMEDITSESELKQQLMEAENQVDIEMRSLFEVLQLNPRVLSDFIEDTEYEFGAINDVLKGQKHVSKKMMFEVFQSVHAVKSNALILNLENFSARLHELESSIKQIQERNEEVVPFDDLLSLVIEIDGALREKDYLKAAISKIENFRKMYGESSNQEIYVLVETLTQICKKSQSALDKKVKLVVEGIDEVVLDYGPRRIIKEVLTQLVRNSVYHGIETPQERVPLGKEPEGELRFSIKYKDNFIVIKFTDNGRGIDFAAVKRKAIASNMFSNPADINDKNMLIKVLFMPGFTTLDDADLHSGRGVGLSLVKDRVKSLLGNITVSTVPGRGTTFTITIPMELPVFS